MRIVYPGCAGLDVHKESVEACVPTPGPGRESAKQIKELGTASFAVAPRAAGSQRCAGVSCRETIGVLAQGPTDAAELAELARGRWRAKIPESETVLEVRVSDFPSILAGAGLCPGNQESAGQRRSGRSHHGSRWIQEVMTENAWAATRSKTTYRRAQSWESAGHRGKKRALVAVADTPIQAAWHMLSNRQPSPELGSQYPGRLDQKEKVVPPPAW